MVVREADEVGVHGRFGAEEDENHGECDARGSSKKRVRTRTRKEVGKEIRRKGDVGREKHGEKDKERGTNFDLSFLTGSLQISTSTEEDGGKYECVAENAVGTAFSLLVNLYVRG